MYPGVAGTANNAGERSLAALGPKSFCRQLLNNILGPGHNLPQGDPGRPFICLNPPAKKNTRLAMPCRVHRSIRDRRTMRHTRDWYAMPAGEAQSALACSQIFMPIKPIIWSEHQKRRSLYLSLTISRSHIHTLEASSWRR